MDKRARWMDYHKRGKRAQETRLQRERTKEMRRRGKKADKTATKSERGYIDELIKNQKLNRNQILHHVGLPDLMVITNDGKVKFYEIKPRKGALKRRLLNSKQAEAIKEALKNQRVEEISLVAYSKQGRGKLAKYEYDSPIRLTQSNIGKYTWP